MRRHTILTATALGLAAILTLGACSTPPAGQADPDELGGTSEGAQPDDPTEVVKGNDLPDGWPPELPAPQGKLLFGGAESDRVTANFRMNDMAGVDRLFADFLSAGFELLAESDANGTVARAFANDNFRVNISVTPDGDNFSLTYVAVPG